MPPKPAMSVFGTFSRGLPVRTGSTKISELVISKTGVPCSPAPTEQTCDTAESFSAGAAFSLLSCTDATASEDVAPAAISVSISDLTLVLGETVVLRAWLVNSEGRGSQWRATVVIQ